MIREKNLLRQQMYLAIKKEDFEAARYYMDEICKDDPSTKKKSTKWSKDEEEFLIHHTNALGVDKGCIVVAKKLNRSKETVRAKYYKLTRKELTK